MTKKEYMKLLQLEKMGFKTTRNRATYGKFQVVFSDEDKCVHIDFLYERRLLCGMDVTSTSALSLLKDILIEIVASKEYFPEHFKDVQSLFYIVLKHVESSEIKSYEKRKIKKYFQKNMQEYKLAMEQIYGDKGYIFNNLTGLYYQLENKDKIIFISNGRIIDIVNSHDIRIVLKKEKWYKNKITFKQVCKLLKYLEEATEISIEKLQKFTIVKEVVDDTDKSQHVAERALYNDINEELVFDILHEMANGRNDEDE